MNLEVLTTMNVFANLGIRLRIHRFFVALNYFSSKKRQASN